MKLELYLLPGTDTFALQAPDFSPEIMRLIINSTLNTDLFFSFSKYDGVSPGIVSFIFDLLLNATAHIKFIQSIKPSAIKLHSTSWPSARHP